MGTSAKEYGIETILRVDPAGSVEERYRRDRQAGDSSLLTADEISEQFRVPLTDVALWYAGGRLHGVYLDGQPRRFRRTQVVAVLAQLAAEKERAARRVPQLTGQDRDLLVAVASEWVQRRGVDDVLVDRTGRVRRYLHDAVANLPPRLVELPPSQVYRLTAKGAACLPEVHRV
jgi:hypothetical protein